MVGGLSIKHTFNVHRTGHIACLRSSRCPIVTLNRINNLLKFCYISILLLTLNYLLIVSPIAITYKMTPNKLYWRALVSSLLDFNSHQAVVCVFCNFTHIFYLCPWLIVMWWHMLFIYNPQVIKKLSDLRLKILETCCIIVIWVWNHSYVRPGLTH
jgi:hypothetical protein